jgi:hypothetical protein
MPAQGYLRAGAGGWISASARAIAMLRLFYAKPARGASIGVFAGRFHLSDGQE